MRIRQRGAGLLIVVLLLVTVAAFAVIVAASQSGGDIYGSDANADGMQALYLAESGIERALKRFATGTACDVALAETITDLSTVGLGTTTHQIVIGTGLTTDFAGVALPATQCRVPVTGTLLARNISRTVHAIIDRNLLGAITAAVPPAFNPAFNNPLTAGAPSSWTLTQPAGQTGYANNGGPDLQGAACSRSAYVIKPLTNNYESRAQGVANVNFTVTGGTATTVTFHYRINDRGANAGCAGGGADIGPADICAGAGGNEGTVCFRTTEAAGANPSTGTLNSNNTVTQAVACPDAGAQSAFAPCQTGYQAGYPTKGSVAFNITGVGTRTITTFMYMLRLQAGGRREMYLDHIEATNTTAIGAAHVRMWRDCSTALNPVTCV
jgi:hypothetical protein